MNAVVERSEHSQMTLKVEVEPDVVAKATDKAYQRLVQRVNIPGFRRGKAPRRILERTVGVDALYREALDFVMPSAYQDAVRENQISPYAQPQFEVVQLEPEKPLIFKATFAIDPEVELGDYHTIKVEPEAINIGAEEVQKALDNLQTSNGQWVPVDGREIQMGDQVSLDVVTSVNGREVANGTPQDVVAELDAETPYPSWANALAGLRIGDTKELADEVAEDANSGLAGAKLEHRVTIKAIKEKELPAVDDELARSVGDYEDLNALKADLKKRLEQQARRNAKMKFEDAAVDKLVELSKIEFPEVMIEEKLDQMAREADLDFQRQGFSLATFLRATGREYEALRGEWRPQAETRIKAQLVLREVANKENLTATDEDIESEIQRMVDNTTPDRRAQLRQTAGTPTVRESIRQSLSARRALNLLDELAGGKEFIDDELDEDPLVHPIEAEVEGAVVE